MNPGDWVLYLGDIAPWIAGYCYEWTGTWRQVPFVEMDKYVAARKDMTEGKGIEAFAALFVDWLWVGQAMIDRIRAGEIEMILPGVIRSQGFTGVAGNTAGYLLRAIDGMIEAYGAKFRNITVDGASTFNGKITANDESTFNGSLTVNAIIKGKLDGLNTVALGSVSSGTAHTLRSNNNLVIFKTDDEARRNTLKSLPIKTIRVVAGGSCYVRLRFPAGQNRSRYRIVLNGNEWLGWTTCPSTNNGVANHSNMPLISGMNIIELYGESYYTNYGQTIDDFANTTFELLCAQDPGLLGFSG